MRDDLDEAILVAHERGDGRRLASLYRQAADRFEQAGNADVAWFFLTQAYVFALEEGLSQSKELRRRLIAGGREAPHL